MPSASTPAPTPSAPTHSDQARTVYTDNAIDRAFIWLFARKMAKAVGQGTDLKGYDGFVDLSHKIMRGRDSQSQQQVVSVVLRSLVPAPVLYLIRTLFSPTRLVCELNAWFATKLFVWLVGPCGVQEVAIVEPDGRTHDQRSKVLIEKCRYLEQSQCVGMCVNMCKLPTQRFFTEDFGIPVTLVPNFEDYSCEMIFGQIPPDVTTEEAYHEPCLAACPTAKTIASCPKVRG
jgi:Beta-carotene isomerase D27-like, C-terminal